MNRLEHLQVIAMEECSELAQRLSKSMRFGMEESQPGQDATNRERVLDEYADLIAVMRMAGFNELEVLEGAIEAKQAKVEKYLRYSKSQGTLQEGGAG